MNTLNAIVRNATGPMPTLIGAGALLLLGACSSSNAEITPQLVDARRVVTRAQVSRTAKLAPAQMDDAWRAFMAAERAHEEDPGSYREGHLAYVAQRKAEAANASAKTLVALRTERALDQRYQAKLARDANQPQQEVAVVEEQVVEDQVVEDEAANALEGLKDVAEVKKDANTVVITLSSAVLFPTAGDTLSDGARKSLDRVAHAINAQPEGSHIRVEGYTDSRGTQTFNEALSLRRAESVSDYLASQGVDREKLRAEGRGEDNPIATNDTEDGRASNRRAEIVIELAQRAEQQPATKPAAPTRKTPTSSSSAKSMEDKDMGEPKEQKEPKEQNGSELPMAPFEPPALQP